MPTYGYQCRECGHQFEVFQKITDAAITACASCGGPVKKLLYPVGIAFKGSGFYVNDYAPKSSARATDNNGAAASDKNDVPATKSDAPSTTTETKTETPKTENPAPAAAPSTT